jgi:hypothetical protein
MRYVVIERKLVAGAQMANNASHGEPHFALDHERPNGERVSMEVQNGRWSPASLQYFIETPRSRIRFKRLKGWLIHSGLIVES